MIIALVFISIPSINPSSFLNTLSPLLSPSLALFSFLSNLSDSHDVCLMIVGSSSYVPGSSTQPSGNFSDPFTGGGRYIPPASDSPAATQVPASGADPFTGTYIFHDEFLTYSCSLMSPSPSPISSLSCTNKQEVVVTDQLKLLDP